MQRADQRMKVMKEEAGLPAEVSPRVQPATPPIPPYVRAEYPDLRIKLLTLGWSKIDRLREFADS